MRLAAVLVMLALALVGCGASEDEMAAAVQEAEQPLTEQLAESERQNLLLQREVAAAEAAVERAREEAAAAVVKAKADAEQALATQTAAVQAKEAQVLAREQAAGVAEAQAAANTFSGSGTYIVGDDIQPGTYKSDGGDPCYWARLDSAGEILDNNIGAGPAVVTVRQGDFSLEVQRCAAFTKTG